MPSRQHQSLVMLLLDYPELLVELVRRNLSVHLPDDLELEAGPETVRLRGSERIADGVVVLRRRRGRVIETFVVEAQRRRDAEKRKAWAVYVAGTWARLGCAVTLVVVTASRSVARWAAEPIDLGRGRMVLCPVVIGPDEIPSEMPLADAHAWPEGLALSVTIHGHKSGSLRLGRTALRVARKLLASGDHRRMVLAELIVGGLNEHVRRTVEAEMKIGGEVYFTKWGKAYGRMRAQALAKGRSEGIVKGRSEGIVKGRSEGIVKGRSEGMAKALHTVLRGRGLEPSKTQQERIEGCGSVRQLEKWLARALVAGTVAEVLRR
jgi:hypothetical protein